MLNIMVRIYIFLSFTIQIYVLFLVHILDEERKIGNLGGNVDEESSDSAFHGLLRFSTVFLSVIGPLESILSHLGSDLSNT